MKSTTCLNRVVISTLVFPWIAACAPPAARPEAASSPAGAMGAPSLDRAPGSAPDTIRAYGPGGPLPAMKDAAVAFERLRGVHVIVTGGPTPQWLGQARVDADVIFSGAEHMMTDFIGQLAEATAGRIDEATITPLYLRPSAILVRPGNPRSIRRFEDLLRPGVKVLVVQGAGQTGLWEDMAGRTGDIRVVRALRANIGAFASNSADARQRWMNDTSFDAWIIWRIWQVANPTVADLVPVAEPWVINRDAGVALTVRGRERRAARDFAEFLRSAEGARIFARWGWMTEQ